MDGYLKAYQLPEAGTAVEKAAMAAHATRTHKTYLPNGDPGNFILNGLPPVSGAPFASPGVTDDGNSNINTRRYKAANIQIDAVLNKKGWHYPQQRIITLWDDVQDTVQGKRPPQPFFFRGATGETIEFWHTNLVPNYYELDDFQVRTPTDILGQHIHLVKFDVSGFRRVIQRLQLRGRHVQPRRGARADLRHQQGGWPVRVRRWRPAVL